MDPLKKVKSLAVAKAKLLIARTLLNSALAEIIGGQDEFSAEYIAVQTSFDKWIDAAQLQTQAQEAKITDGDL